MAGSGLFLSFEGIDGSGKSTQARVLAEALRSDGHIVTLTREPGGSPGAEEIRRLVLEGPPDRWSAETEILLFTAARRDHLEKTIRPALERGEMVITDRFADSTRVYQGTSRGDLRAMVDRLHEAMIGVEPDVTLLIDMDPERALARSLARLAGGQDEASGETGQAAAGGFAGSASSTDAPRDSDSSSARTSAETTSAIMNRSQSADDGMDLSDGARRAISHAMTALLAAEDRFESFGPLFQARLRTAFLDLAAAHPRFIVIDGDRDPETIAADIAARVRARLGA